MTPIFTPISGIHPLHRVETLSLVAIGGFAGSNFRYFVATVFSGLSGTLIANVTGSLALGVVLYEAHYTDHLATETRTVLATGFVASYTTYSTFAVETALATPALAVTNVVANYGLGFAGVLAGRSIARRFEGAT